MKTTWTGILLMIILAVATISTTSAAKTTNVQQKQLNIDEQSSQTEAVVASDIETTKEHSLHLEASAPSNKEYVSVAPENDAIRLYPMQVEGSGYIYKGLVLEVNGKTREFSDWTAEGGSNKPEIHEIDLNGDGQKEIVVMFTQGHGTGIYLGQAYIIHPETLEVMKMQSLEDIVKQHVESNIDVTAGQVAIDVSIDGVKGDPIRIQEETEGMQYYDQLLFGDVIYYGLENGQLVVSVSGAYGFAVYGGELKFAYGYEDGEWKAVNVHYTNDEYEDGYEESFD